MMNAKKRYDALFHAIFLTALVLSACGKSCTPSLPHQFTVANDTDVATTVYVAFGANSTINAASWDVCGAAADGGVVDAGVATGGLNCSFPLGPKASIGLPLGRQYLNATVSFGAPVGCGTTKAEININNSAWYDVVDVSLVDGYSNKIKLEIDDTAIVPKGASGNENVFGVFPLGCDICIARQNPPCGQTPGYAGCKVGTQYDPKPPCQYQGKQMGGGSKVRVALVD